MKILFSFEHRMLAGLGAAVIVVAGLAVVTWTVTTNATEAGRGVARTHEMLNSLSRVESDGLKIELSTQNFRLTGDPSLIAERDATVAKREVTLARIQQLASDTATQRDRYKLLREVIYERLAIAQEVGRIRITSGPQAAALFAGTAPLRETRNRMYGLLHEMEAEESRLLAVRLDSDLKAGQQVVLANLTAAVLLGASLLSIYLVMRRQARETEANREAMAETEEQLSITLRSIGDGVLATDTNGHIIRMNPLAEQLTGWHFEHARGRPADEVFCTVNEHTRETEGTAVGSVLATGKLTRVSGQTVLVARDGRETPIAGTGAPIHGRDGRIIGVVLVFRDESLARVARRTIHARNEVLEQRVEQRTAALRDSQAHLLGVISNVPVMIAFVNAGQRYVYANRQYVDRFALIDIIGCTVREILGEKRYAIAAPMIAKALRGEEISYDWEPFPGVWQVVSYVPAFNDERAVVGYYVLGTDITERKRSEHQIQVLNEQLKQHVRELEHVGRGQ